MKIKIIPGAFCILAALYAQSSFAGIAITDQFNIDSNQISNWVPLDTIQICNDSNEMFNVIDGSATAFIQNGCQTLGIQEFRRPNNDDAYSRIASFANPSGAIAMYNSQKQMASSYFTDPAYPDSLVCFDTVYSAVCFAHIDNVFFVIVVFENTDKASAFLEVKKFLDFYLEQIRVLENVYVLFATTRNASGSMLKDFKVGRAPDCGDIVCAFSLTETGSGCLKISDVKGNAVAGLVLPGLHSGINSFLWHPARANGTAIAPGCYVFRLTIGKESATGCFAIGPYK
jgi:hypothetical protein